MSSPVWVQHYDKGKKELDGIPVQFYESDIKPGREWNIDRGSENNIGA